MEREEAIEALRRLGIAEVPNGERDWIWFWRGMAVQLKDDLDRLNEKTAPHRREMNAKDLRRSNAQVMAAAKLQLAQYIQGQISTEQLCNLWGLNPREHNAIQEWLEGGIRIWCRGFQTPSYDGR